MKNDLRGISTLRNLVSTSTVVGCTDLSIIITWPALRMISLWWHLQYAWDNMGIFERTGRIACGK